MMVRAQKRALTRIARTEVRRTLGGLRNLQISALLRLRYEAAVGRYFQFLEDSQLPTPATDDDLDTSLSDYICELWDDGASKSEAANVLSGIGKFVPGCKKSFPTAWALFTTWGRHELPDRAAPLPIDLLKAMVAHSFHEDDDCGFATLTLLSFHCLLRISEGLNLRGMDICFGDEEAVLNLGYTKGGKRRGEKEFVTCSDPLLLSWLRRVMSRKEPGDRLFNLDYNRYRRMFTDKLQTFGAGNLNFKTHSLRRGGTTFEFKSHGSYDIICQRGRWTSSRTARLYITEAAELHTRIHFTAYANRHIQKFAAMFERLSV
jgi:hypothetical protein